MKIKAVLTYSLYSLKFYFFKELKMDQICTYVFYIKKFEKLVNIVNK